jgi:hypothetical protein
MGVIDTPKMSTPTPQEEALCELAECLRTHSYPLDDLFDPDPPACPRCGSSDTYETDCFGHPFGSYTCRECGDYSIEFERNGRICFYMDVHGELVVADPRGSSGH